MLDPENEGDGGYSGTGLGYIKHNKSPNKKRWTYDQCARACLDPAHSLTVGFKKTSVKGKECAYFLLSEQRGCSLKTGTTGFVPNYKGSTVTDHADCGCDLVPRTTKGPTTEAPPTTEGPSFPADCKDEGKGAYRKGPVYATIKAVTNGLECATLCSKDSDCAYYHANAKKGCELLKSAAGALASGKYSMGHGTCAVKKPTYPDGCKDEGAGAARKTTAFKVIESILTGPACANLCSEDSKCKAFRVHKSRGCALLDVATGSISKSNAFVAHGTCGGTTVEPTFPDGCKDDGAGAARKGNVFKQEKSITTSPACAILCSEDSDCAYYKTHKTKGCALLKSAAGTLVSGKSFVGLGTCATKKPVYPDGCTDEGAGAARRGDAYSTIATAADGLACATLCSKDSKCAAYRVHKKTGCALLESADGKLATSGSFVGHGSCAKTVVKPVFPDGCKDEGAGAARKGNAFKQEKSITTGPACAILCSEDSDCAYYKTHKTKGCALLKSAAGTLVSGKSFVGHGTCKRGATAGEKTCKVSESKGDLQQGKGYYKGSAKITQNKTNKTVAACQAACSKTTQCTYFLQGKAKGCYLYKGRSSSWVKSTGFLGFGECTDPK